MKRRHGKILTYILITAVGIIMIYPLVWLFLSSFKTNEEIFGSIRLLPERFIFESYVKGWQKGQFTYTTFLKNTFVMVIPTVFFTVVSSAVVAYGFTRFRFPLKRILFAIMLSTLMLPNAVIIVPRYILFRSFDWLDSYLPFIVPAVFATYPFFIFMLVQFFRGLPRELDESATIDGCNSFMILLKIIIPLSKPALISAAIFQFVWTWNDFFNPFIYINSVSKYTIQIALRMSIDVIDKVNWNQIIAMSVVSILPPTILFFFAQRYFVEGTVTTGIKG